MMINIDGSKGEGGGQIIRTSLSLSALTGKPFSIKNIRAGRHKPGLMRQHLTALKATAAICGGKYSALNGVGTREFFFHPGTVTGGRYEFAIGTAGSTMLVLQTILPPLLLAQKPSHIEISGGTHNPMSPPFDFVAGSYSSMLEKMGANIKLHLARPGFVPAGGGCVVAQIEPVASLVPLKMLEPGKHLATSAKAIFCNMPFDIASRELDTLGKALDLGPDQLKPHEVKADGSGNALIVNVEHENKTEQFTAFGQRGKKAEQVADDLADEVKAFVKANVAIGPHLADQLLLPMAMAGEGSFTTLEPTLHTLTNAAVIEEFLPVKISFDKLATGQG
ncbi:MAG: RNA 3'-terminal phosphate cyclase [Hyphomicrobiaceae bacterium]|nr:RNA 3'-terminal phosphate cyclase [Hyphomicrobiaceae bacterium]